MNENEKNISPADDGSRTSASEGENDTKAFKWEWTDADEQCEQTSHSHGSEKISDAIEQGSTQDLGTEDHIESDKAGPDDEKEISAPDTAEEITDTSIIYDGKTAPCVPKNEAADKKSKKKRLNTHTIACILSGCSIILLLALTAALVLGILPLNRSGVWIGVSGQGATLPETEASPELIEDFLNSVVVVSGRTNSGAITGTGIIISSDGYIITNYHVIDNADNITVLLYNEDVAVKAEVVGYHASDDIAVLKIDRTGLRAAVFADSEEVRYGEKIYAIGTPKGSEFRWSVSQGIVSCPLREYLIYDDEGILERKLVLVQTDASVNNGNSGGPIINTRGEVVGIVTLKRSDSVGLGFALPADGVVKNALAIIELGGSISIDSGISRPRPLIGITGVGVQGDTYYESLSNEEGSMITIVDKEYAEENPDTTFYAPISGVHISNIGADSDAAGHLNIGDIITEVNGYTVADIYDVMDVINMQNGGDAVIVKYYRDGQYHSTTLILGTAN